MCRPELETVVDDGRTKTVVVIRKEKTENKNRCEYITLTQSLSSDQQLSNSRLSLSYAFLPMIYILSVHQENNKGQGNINLVSE